MMRFLFLCTTVTGIVLVIFFSAEQKKPVGQLQPDCKEALSHNFSKDAGNFSVSDNNQSHTLVEDSIMSVFSMGELKHYLCALEVKNRNTKAIIMEESAVVCSKTIPEYLAEPTCK